MSKVRRLLYATYNGHTTSRATAQPYTHCAVVAGHTPGGTADWWITWHTSEALALKGNITGSQRSHGARVIAVVPVMDVAPVVTLLGSVMTDPRFLRMEAQVKYWLDYTAWDLNDEHNAERVLDKIRWVAHLEASDVNEAFGL